MKIVFIGDNHGELSLLREVALLEYDADVFFHLGDSELLPKEIEPFVGVLGNCDHPSSLYPYERSFSLPSGKRLLMRHRPISEEEAMALSKKGYRYLFHGHTHKREERQVGGLLSFSPGSLSFPRDEQYGSYIVLLGDKEGEKVLFKNVKI